MKKLKPLKVKIYGLFPTLYTICSPCLSGNYVDSARDFRLKQFLEYPRWIRENNRRVLSLVKDLINYFGNRIRIDIVNADSLRGIFFALRYRLKNEIAVVVEGRVFKGEELSFNALKEYIKKVLSENYLTV